MGDGADRGAYLGPGITSLTRGAGSGLRPSTEYRGSHHRAIVNRMSRDSQTPSGSTWPPSRGPFTRWPRAADAVLAVIVFLWSVLISDEDPEQDLALRDMTDLPVAAFFVFAVASGALYWRRHRPLVVLGLNLAALATLMGLGYPDSMWGLPIALYSVGRYANDDQLSYVGVGATLALTAISTLVDGEAAGSIGFVLVFVFAIWYIGRRIRIRGGYLKLLQERAAQLEREQAAEARRAVAEERTRIARELHDVVAHRVSLMTVQAGAAKTVASDDPEASLRAMEAVENAGRQALDELRHLMGVLRPAAEADELGPQPGLADVPRLVERLTEAGLEVSLTMDRVQTDDLPARVDLSTYRIVQEALTNVLKHAGPGACAEVRLGTDNDEVTIEVLDNGHGATILPGSGHGIAGMRERTQLLGGSLDAGPRPAGGFQVVAHLPTDKEPI